MSASDSTTTARYDRRLLRWNGWGPEGRRFAFGEREPAIWAWVSEALGGRPLQETAPASLDAIEVAPSALPADVRESLTQIVGRAHLRDDAYERVFHAMGRSFRDILRLRQGRVERVPDAVVYPATHDEVQQVLRLCATERIAVIPFGGGSSVVGGVECLQGEAHRAVITLDTTRMRAVLAIDPVAQTATVQTGIYGPELEEALAEHGLTLGHFPQSFEYSTLGGWIAARGAGQQSNGYGVAAAWTVALRVATPEGEVVTQPFPNSSSGPDLNHLLAGSEGVLGVITEATIRLTVKPELRSYQGVLFPTFEAGTAAIRAMVQVGLSMAMMRLSDADETMFLGAFGSVGKPVSKAQGLIDKTLQWRGFDDRKAIMLMGVEGKRVPTHWTMTRALAIAVKHGGIPLGAGMGTKWYAGRFEMPYLREPMMDRGIGVETLETSTSWSNMERLHGAVAAAIRDAIRARGANESIVMCHISHSYATGASLYFTFAWPMTPGEEMDDWASIKKAASDAIRDHGGTISHHHGVGADHLPWMAAEKGAGAIKLLQAARTAMDPHGVMNPGKLVPPAR